jgi:hypothetical protein
LSRPFAAGCLTGPLGLVAMADVCRRSKSSGINTAPDSAGRRGGGLELQHLLGVERIL